LRRRFLVDVLRIKSENRFLNFIFIKSRSDGAARLLDYLDETVGRAETTPHVASHGKVISISAS
jgi:hypothetical protein